MNESKIEQLLNELNESYSEVFFKKRSEEERLDILEYMLKETEELKELIKAESIKLKQK